MIDDLRAAGQISADVGAAMVITYEECKDLFPLVPDMDESYTRWLRRAAESGDPLAKSWDALMSYPNFDEHELKVLVRDALTTREPEAYEHAMIFYANVPSEDVNATAIYEAWSLLWCEVTRQCNVEELRAAQQRNYKRVENLRIQTIAISLREAIDRQRWSDLGF